MDSVELDSALPRKAGARPPSTRESNSIECSSSQLRNHDRIASLQPNILLRILAFDHFFVVERNSLLRSVWSLPKNVDRLLFREVFEPPGHRNRIKHGGSTRQQIGTCPRNHPHDVY